MLETVKDRLSVIEKAVLTDVKDQYLEFKCNKGNRTIFLKLDKILDKEKIKFDLGKEYKLEHINGMARLTLVGLGTKL